MMKNFLQFFFIKKKNPGLLCNLCLKEEEEEQKKMNNFSFKHLVSCHVMSCIYSQLYNSFIVKVIDVDYITVCVCVFKING